MPAYLVADVQIHDPEGYEAYRAGVLAAARPYGGRYLVRGGQAELLEGTQPPARVVIVEFDSMRQLKAFWDSPQYTPLRRIRERCATSRIYAVEGLDTPLA
jgi:uncharacterized protein (DUF1330 family)